MNLDLFSIQDQFKPSLHDRANSNNNNSTAKTDSLWTAFVYLFEDSDHIEDYRRRSSFHTNSVKVREFADMTSIVILPYMFHVECCTH